MTGLSAAFDLHAMVTIVTPMTVYKRLKQPESRHQMYDKNGRIHNASGLILIEIVQCKIYCLDKNDFTIVNNDRSDAIT